MDIDDITVAAPMTISLETKYGVTGSMVLTAFKIATQNSGGVLENVSTQVKSMKSS